MVIGIAATGAGAHVASAAAVPTVTADQTVNTTIKVSGTFDGTNKRFIAGGALGDGKQAEGQQAVFELANGATLTNVTLGAPAADGVHCLGSCTLRNIIWEDVGEDAATFLGANATVLVDGGSAAKAFDKVFQDNRLAGGSVTIRNFSVKEFGKLYLSCGNCLEQATRIATIQNVTATGTGQAIAGVMVNHGDRVTLSNITITGPGAADVNVCELYEGNNTGAESPKLGTEPDGKACVATGITVK